MVHYIEYNHRFVVQYDRCRLAEPIYDLYTDSRNNSIELVWIPGGNRQVELCFQFEWLGTLTEEVANSKVQLFVQTTELYGSDDSPTQTPRLVEKASCLVSETTLPITLSMNSHLISRL